MLVHCNLQNFNCNLSVERNKGLQIYKSINPIANRLFSSQFLATHRKVTAPINGHMQNEFAIIISKF
jgi:hypothetical protein